MSANSADELADCVIIGAGFVGLAAGAALAAEPASHGKVRILEKGDSVGHFWHGGHEQLSLHSPHHKLPHDGGLSREYPMFKTKAEVREYLDRYATAHGLQDSLRFGQTVTAVEHRPADAAHPWRVQTERGAYRARRVVVATGLNREPHVPAFEGAEAYTGDLRHSWHVRDCRSYRGKRVLVVGSGNSAAELTVALHEAGAASIDLLVDGPRHFVSRATMARIFSLFPLLGLSTDSMIHDLHRCTFGAAAVGDAGVAQRDGAADAASWHGFQQGQDAFIRFLSADLTAHGIRTPPPYPSEQHDALARIPVYDVDDVPAADGTPRRDGVIGLVRRGAVRVLRGRLERFTASGVVVGASGGGGEAAESAYDAVVLGTGFKHGLLDFLRDCCEGDGGGGGGRGGVAPPLLRCETDSRGVVQCTPHIDSRSRSKVVSSIYLVGLDQFRSTLSVGPILGYRGYDVGAEIASELYGTPQTRPFPSLPDNEQTASSPIDISPRRVAGVLFAGIVLGALGSSLRGRRAVVPARKAVRGVRTSLNSP